MILDVGGGIEISVGVCIGSDTMVGMGYSSNTGVGMSVGMGTGVGAGVGVREGEKVPTQVASVLDSPPGDQWREPIRARLCPARILPAGKSTIQA